MPAPRTSARRQRLRFQIRRWRESRAVRRARAAEIIARLQGIYPAARAELDYRDPFQFLVAVILSAQTTDVNVNRVTPNLFRRFATAEALAGATQSEVEEIIRSTGFFRNKAKSIREAAAKLVSEFGGEVPRSMDEMLTLPGVARKTANVVLGEAFGITEGIVVDTHVARLAQRLGLSPSADPVKIERDLMATIDRDEWVFTGHAVIWHGRRVCAARKPACDACVLNDICPSSTVPARPDESPFRRT